MSSIINYYIEYTDDCKWFYVQKYFHNQAVIVDNKPLSQCACMYVCVCVYDREIIISLI